MKTSALSGALLDYWVAKDMLPGLEPRLVSRHDLPHNHVMYSSSSEDRVCILMDAALYEPSTNWALGGLVIESGHVCIGHREIPPHWGADIQDDVPYRWWGDTPLIAAMRAYVASKFGGDVPDEP